MVMKTKAVASKRPAGLGEGFRRANRTVGGFLDDKQFEITDAILRVDSFLGKNFKTGEPEQVQPCNLVVTFNIEGVADPVERSYSCGNYASPYDEAGVEQTEIGGEGIYIGGKGGKPFRGLASSCAAAIFLDKLAELGGYDEETLVEQGTREALVGISGTLMEYVVPQSEADKKKGKKPLDRKPVAVAASLETAAGGAAPKPVGGTVTGATAAKAPAAKVVGAIKPAAVVKKKAPIEPVEEEAEEEAAEEPAEEEAADGDDLETSVTALIVKLVKKAPLTKVALSQAVGKAFEAADKDNKMPAVKLALSDAFLKAGAKAGEWAFDGRTIAAAGE